MAGGRIGVFLAHCPLCSDPVRRLTPCTQYSHPNSDAHQEMSHKCHRYYKLRGTVNSVRPLGTNHLDKFPRNEFQTVDFYNLSQKGPSGAFVKCIGCQLGPCSRNYTQNGTRGKCSRRRNRYSCSALEISAIRLRGRPPWAENYPWSGWFLRRSLTENKLQIRGKYFLKILN